MSLMLMAYGSQGVRAAPTPSYVGGFDGPAELPRVEAVGPLLNFNPDVFFANYEPRVNHTPSSRSELHTLLTGGTLNGQTLQRGDWITLTAGTEYTGTDRRTQTLPVLSGAFDWDDPATWVWVRTANVANLPASGTRVASSDASAVTALDDCPRFDVFQNGGGVYPLIVANGASGYCLTGLGGISAQANWTAGNRYWLAMGIQSTQTVLADLPDGIVVDRCVFLGDPRSWTSVPATPNALWNNAHRTIVRDSWVDAGASRGNLGSEGGGTENQALSGLHWAGPSLIDNNTLIASGENIITGGGDPAVGELRTNGINPTDVIFRRNYCPSRPEWNLDDPASDGYGVVCKNNFELKKGVRWLIEGNDFSYWFLPDQGKAINIKRVNQNGGDTQSRCEDIVFRYNALYDVPTFINFSNEQTADNSIDRISVSHNLVVMEHTERLGISRGASIPTATWGAISFSGVNSWKYANNTTVYIAQDRSPGNMFQITRSPESAAYISAELVNNIVENVGIAFRTNDDFLGNVNNWAGTRIRFVSVVDGGNVLIGGGTTWDPAASAKPTTRAEVFNDLAGGDYEVAEAYRAVGVGSSVPGADIPTLLAKTAGARTGVWT